MIVVQPVGDAAAQFCAGKETASVPLAPEKGFQPSGVPSSLFSQLLRVAIDPRSGEVLLKLSIVEVVIA
jgi:hypothetical protein